MLALLDAAEQSLLDHLNGQPFQIVLLVVFAIYSVRRQNATEAKMEKYISEDRERANAVINNNTKALEKFNELWPKITSFLVFCFLMVGCRTTKRESSHSFTGIKTELNSTASVFADRYTQKRDSLLGISARTVQMTLSGDDLKPVYNDKGQAKGNTTQKKENGVTLTATAQPDGTLVLNGTCDSLTLRIQNLTSENYYLQSLQSTTESQWLKSSTAQSTAKTKTAFPGTAYFAFLAGMACCWMLNRFSIPTLLKTLFTRERH